MAEIAVGMVLEQLISFLGAEVKLFGGLKKQVEDIMIELEYSACFLRDADSMAEKEDTNGGLKLWVKHVREVAYQIEDVMDEYMLYHVTQHRQQGLMAASLAKIVHLVKTVKRQRRTASKIREIKTRFVGIKERSERYGFKFNTMPSVPFDGIESNNRRQVNPRMGLHFIDSEALVGIDSSLKELAHRVADAELRRMIVSVVGMGGVGKTTLVKRVFDDQVVAGHFDCHAWITVSQSYKVEALLRTMLRQMYESRKQSPPVSVGTMDGVELISKCRDYLYDKRYIVVFDDVWEELFWRDMEHTLLDNNKGSRILMTTRNMNAADFCKKSSLVHVHNLEPLPLELAQELLCRTAFLNDEDRLCPEELKGLAFEIVKRCEGLPLAIVAIGGLLATKGKDGFHWKRLLDSLSAEFESSPHLSHIKQILSFSYYNLPYYLKGCFLFLGMFPEDCSINCKRLIRMWIAEGFVKGKHGMTLEEVAMTYLTELINRSLVQVSMIDSIGDVRNCQLHDLMREVVLSKAEELSFIQTCPANLSSHNRVARYLSICNKSNNSPVTVGNCQTHLAIFFDIEELPKSLCVLFFTKFKLLKEMDFEGAPLTSIPEELGNLLHLKYLSIRDTKVKKLPKSVGKLHKLQTLDLKRSLVSELPGQIKTLVNLQYLVAYYKDKQSIYNINTRKAMKLNGNFGSLESLEKLYEVDLEAYSGGNFFHELARLKQLRKLCITKLKSENGKDVCDAIEQMTHLQSLRISAIKEEELLQLNLISSPPVFLRHLRLRGRLMKLPDWISELRNLTKVTLEWSRISDDSLQILGALPNLLLLYNYKGYNGAQLHFQKNHFKKLQDLGLCGLSDLNRLIIDEGTLTLLEHLEFGPSPQFEELPASISYLKCLKALSINDMSKEFARKLLPNGGLDHWKVKHIPNIYFLYDTFKGTDRQTYKLGDPHLLAYLS
ncbi:disease resistance protein RPM1-like [Hibiscus syriacus]|uniref:disease resistance protein RPM1-like n=1 Tax=Hibiscus syriacus TaxID=106335 RepID=UPI001925138F|nr:disease resistance protein RPM1-like [Hibiscus syriacus]